MKISLQSVTRKVHRAVWPVALATFVVSCVSVTSVTKVTPGRNPKGYRYALPQPYILAVPKSDGSVTYTEMSLPDLSQQYAINTYTFGAKSAVTIEADKLLLKKVTTTKDTTAVAKQILQSGANVAKTQIEEDAKRRDAKVAAETKASETIATKQLALKLAQAERAALPATASADAIAAADLNVRKAQIELEATMDQYKGILGANLASDKTVPGPVLFKVVDHGDGGVQLVAVKINGHAQPRFESSSKNKPPVPIPTARAMVSGNTINRSKLAGSMEVGFTVEPDGSAFEVTSIKGGTPSQSIDGFIVNPTGPKQYLVTITPIPTNGTYDIRYNVTPPGGKTKIAGAAKVLLVD